MVLIYLGNQIAGIQKHVVAGLGLPCQDPRGYSVCDDALQPGNILRASRNETVGTEIVHS